MISTVWLALPPFWTSAHPDCALRRRECLNRFDAVMDDIRTRAQRHRYRQVDPDNSIAPLLTDIIAAVGEGRVDRAFELTPPELADKLSIAGTPEECTAKIKSEIASTGVNHLILAITDAALVKAFSGMDLPGVATMREQLQLVHDHVMPAFATQPA
jgi:alkanesulfonate monooxygenase SsuD/methylene tetrahydromethanopterin reductase-like flavin-dependent oxidoreductase (luciferase family)